MYSLYVVRAMVASYSVTGVMSLRRGELLFPGGGGGLVVEKLEAAGGGPWGSGGGPPRVRASGKFEGGGVGTFRSEIVVRLGGV